MLLLLPYLTSVEERADEEAVDDDEENEEDEGEDYDAGAFLVEDREADHRDQPLQPLLLPPRPLTVGKSLMRQMRKRTMKATPDFSPITRMYSCSLIFFLLQGPTLRPYCFSRTMVRTVKMTVARKVKTTRYMKACSEPARLRYLTSACGKGDS